MKNEGGGRRKALGRYGRLIVYCIKCESKGAEGGCSDCGRWPRPDTKKINGALCKWLETTYWGCTGNAEAYKKVAAEHGLRIFFEKNPLDRWNEPIEDPYCVGIWLAVDDIPLARKTGLWLFYFNR